MQKTAFKENVGTDPRPVMYGIALDIKDYAFWFSRLF
jgi:hypothetical protein